jgi:NTP pyrophosphatase (non-canonical NTP hydrolase)
MIEELKISIETTELKRLIDEYNAANKFDYLAESERTASASFHGDLVDFNKFLEALSKCMTAAEELDRYKKLLFYGEDARKNRFGDVKQLGKFNGWAIIESLTGSACERPKAEQAVHAILGIATEAGELIEALFIALADPESGGLDFVNTLEEVGDLQWYEAMLCRITGKTFDEVQRTNIAKLRQRFPDKFNETAANVRDLEKERAILENGGAPIGKVQMADPFFTHDGNKIP